MKDHRHRNSVTALAWCAQSTRYAALLCSLSLFACGDSGNPSASSNSPPSLEAIQSLETDEDQAASLVIPVTDLDSDILSFQVVEAPKHGVITFETGVSPSLTYTPAENFNGSDELKYRASDNRSTSGIATLSIEIRPVDDPAIVRIVELPPQEALTIVNLEAEILDVDGDGDTAVPVGWDVPSFNVGGFLWTETIDAFTITVKTPSFPSRTTLTVEFLAMGDDGSIITDSMDVVVRSGPDYDGDGVTDFRDTDDDADGWADFVERQLGFDTLSADSRPPPDDPRLLGLEIDDDSDGDGISDVQEEAWGWDPFDSRSVPPDSDSDGFPDYARHLAIGRAVPFDLELGLPIVMAAEHNSRVFDVGDGAAELEVTFTAVSPVPITNIELALQIVETNSQRTLLQFFNRGVYPIASPRRVIAGTIRMPLNQYLPPSQFRTIFVGNTVGFDYRGQPNDRYLQSFLNQSPGIWSGDTRITVANSGTVDLDPPELVSFTLQNDVIDVGTSVRALTYEIELADDLSGALIHQLRITQTTGATYNRATDSSFHFPAVNRVQYSGTTSDITRDISVGVLGGLDFIITDFAGNETILRPRDLQELGLPHYVVLDNSMPDAATPSIEHFGIITEAISRSSGDRVQLRVSASDSETEIREVVAIFHKIESYNNYTYATFYIGREFDVGDSTTNALIVSEPLGGHIHAGVYELYRLFVFDRNDRLTVLRTEDLLARGYETRFEVTR